MSADRPKVGDVFRAPDHVGGLAGLLGPVSPAQDGATEAPEQGDADTSRGSAAGESADPARTRSKASARPSRAAALVAKASADHVAVAEIRIVPVVLDVSVISDLRAFAVRTELTQGVVTLRAIEANAGELAKHWSQRQVAAPASGRLFGNTRTVHRRTEPGVQTQLRMAAADAVTLDRLVADWSAPSRSALVNEALRRYVRPSPVVEPERREATS